MAVRVLEDRADNNSELELEKQELFSELERLLKLVISSKIDSSLIKVLLNKYDFSVSGNKLIIIVLNLEII